MSDAAKLDGWLTYLVGLGCGAPALLMFFSEANKDAPTIEEDRNQIIYGFLEVGSIFVWQLVALGQIIYTEVDDYTSRPPDQRHNYWVRRVGRQIVKAAQARPRAWLETATGSS